MAAIGRIKSPTLFLRFNPPHLPRNNTAFGAMALNRSITVAAFGLPMPKLIRVIPSAVTLGIGRSTPFTKPLCALADHSKEFLKFVRRKYFPKSANDVAV